jgi:CRISPR/Cas system-associated endonuclease Cas1
VPKAALAVTFMSESGRLFSRVDTPGSGNVLLRRTQFRWADLEEKRTEIARAVVAGKVQNCRNLLLRAARESKDEVDATRLEKAVRHLADVLPALPGYSAIATGSLIASASGTLGSGSGFAGVSFIASSWRNARYVRN